MATIGGYADINVNLRFWMERILQALDRPRIVYDIGANEGQLTVPLLDQIDTLVAFEPNPQAVERLSKRFSLSPPDPAGHRIVPIALGDRSGRADLIRYSDDSFNTLYRRPESDLKQYQLTETTAEPVGIDRLDNVVKQDGLPDPGLVKIDVEGAELAVLKGARETLTRAVPAIVIEYSCINTANAGYDRGEILTELQRYDYDVRGLYRAEDTNLYSGQALDSCRIWNLVCLPARFRSLAGPCNGGTAIPEEPKRGAI